MKFGVVVFPGSNCDRDMQEALQNDLNQEYISVKDNLRKTWNNWLRLRRRKKVPELAAKDSSQNGG